MLLEKLTGFIKVKYIAVLAAVAAVATLGYLWLAPSGQQRQEKIARQQLEEGVNAYKQRDTYKALSALQKAMELTKDGLNDTIYFEAAVYNALLYQNAGLLKEARQRMKPLEYIEVKNSFASLFYLRAVAIQTAQLDGNYDMASKYMEQAMDLSRRMFPDNKRMEYVDKANVCELNYMKGDKQKAWQGVREIEHTNLKLEPYHDMCFSEVYYVHGALLYDEAQYDSAYHYAEKGYTCAKNIGQHANELLTLQLKCRIDSVRNDLKAYQAHRNAIDQLNMELKPAEILAQEALIKEQAKIDQLKQDNDRKQLANTLLIVLLVVLAVFFVFVVYTIRKDARNKQRLAELEKERLDLEINRKKLENELLKFKQQDTELKLDRANKDNAHMNVILSNQEDGKREGETLGSLENNLRLKYPDFMEHMKAVYPQLTENDIRVLGFMRMGYSSKVIASALNITMNSLTTTRYRLKKKLNLASTEDLKTFIIAEKKE